VLSTALPSESGVRTGSRMGSRMGWSLEDEDLLKKYLQSSMLP